MTLGSPPQDDSTVDPQHLPQQPGDANGDTEQANGTGSGQGPRSGTEKEKQQDEDDGEAEEEEEEEEEKATVFPIGFNLATLQDFDSEQLQVELRTRGLRVPAAVRSK